MSRRRRRHRKRFKCEHRGFGRFCHQCMSMKRKSEGMSVHGKKKRGDQAMRMKKDAVGDIIELGHLPASIGGKARKILERLEHGASWLKMGGKTFHFDRSLIRIPVSYRYRLLCRREQSGITPLAVMTHEAYNPVARNKKRA
jgi:hypothetical protein